MEEKNKIEHLMQEALLKIKNIIDVNTIVGNQICCGDITIIPVTKVVVGFVAGGGEYAQNKKQKNDENYPFAGGSSAGVSIMPIGFIMINKNGYQFITADNKNGFKEILKTLSTIISNMKGKQE